MQICRYIITLLLSVYAVACAAAEMTVKDMRTEVFWRSARSCTWKETRVYEIHDPHGRDWTDFVVNCDESIRLLSFSGTVTDADGKVIHKIKKSDLQRTEYSRELASENYKLWWSYTPPRYPITVRFEWEMECRDNIISFPVFAPQPGFDVAVEHASYTLTAASGLGVVYDRRNIGQEVCRTDNENGTATYTVEVPGLPEIRQEPAIRPYEDIFPRIIFSPESFTYYNTGGSLDSWPSLGNWICSLLKGRDGLPAELKAMLHSRTDTCRTEYGKIKEVYAMLGEQTRYVSIQLGIGGYRPMSASDVWKNGFGDCKALANYMKAMLGEIGIESFYAPVSTVYRKLAERYANFNQINHVVLAVPVGDGGNAADTLWVECTNPELPLGYIHEDIAGHDILVVSDSGCRIQRVPEWDGKENVRQNDISISLTETGSADVSLRSVWRGACYEQGAGLKRLDADDCRKVLYRMFMLPQPETKSDIKCSLIKDSCKVVLEANVGSRKYAGVNGSRMTVRITPTQVMRRDKGGVSERRMEIYEPLGITNREIVNISLPQGYEIEACPSDSRFSNDFGSAELKITGSGDTLSVCIETVVRKGLFPPEKFSDYIKLRERQAAMYEQKIVLKKK